MTIKTENQSIRLFKNPIIESLTHVHPITPLLVWAPIISCLFYRSYKIYQSSAVTFLWLGIAGILIWTLTEYVLHRFVFHYNAKTRVGKYFVFLFHGIHHDDPKDKTRLVMPPLPAVGMVSLLYLFFNIFWPTRYMDGFMGFFLIGYLIYDYIHYATHHFPMKNKVARYLKAYHLQHHYSKKNDKYGVSNPLWDYILNTVEEKIQH